MFYFVSYVWLQVVFGQENDQALHMLSNKNLPTLYYPNHLPISPKPRYSTFYTEGNKRLTNYITSKIFQSWRKQIQKVVSFKKNKKETLLKDIVKFWSEYSTRKLINRAKLQECEGKLTTLTLSSTFSAMKEYLLMKANLTNRLKLYKNGHRIKTLKGYLVEWRIKHRKSLIQSEQDEIADQM